MSVADPLVMTPFTFPVLPTPPLETKGGELFEPSIKETEIPLTYLFESQHPMKEGVSSQEAVKALGFTLPEALAKRLKEEGRPLRIEILDCSGGEGHKKSADAVQNAVKAHFAEKGIEVEFKRKDIGAHMSPDPLGKLTFGKYGMIDLYNTLLRHGRTGMIKAMSKVGELIHPFFFNSNVNYFNKRFDSKAAKGCSPDLVISAVPMVNGPLLTALKERNIPLLVVTTDADNRFFSLNWPKGGDFAPYRYCIPYNSLEIANKVNSAVDPANIRGIGYPVRSEFLKAYTTEEKKRFRKQLGIDPGKKVVGVMMGGNGGVALEDYFKRMLSSIKEDTLKYKNLHFAFICGSNHSMESNLIKKAENFGFKIKGEKGEATRLVHPSGVSLSIVGFTKNVHKYMALSDCFVTKAGSSSFNECLCMGVPMLIDQSSGCLPWEELNLELAETYHFGQRVKSIGDFVSQLNDMLEPSANKGYHDAMVEYRKDRPEQGKFAEKIVELSYELLEEAEKARAKKIAEEELQATLEKSKAAVGIETVKNTSAIEWLKGVCLLIAETAKKVYDLVVTILLIPVTSIIWGLKWLAKATIDFAYFSGFKMKDAEKLKRRKGLIQGMRLNEKGEMVQSPHKAKPIEGSLAPLYSSVSKRPIDALYIKSGAKERTGNVILYVLGKDYQASHPKNFDHILDDGADVVLFNPSENTAKAMAADLKAIIQELRQRNPDQKILLHGYCIGAHVAASVATDLADEQGLSLPVVVDRGYGDGYKLAKKASSIAKIPYAKKYINKYYNNSTHERIHKHKGAMLFLSPTDGDDQLIHKIRKGKKVKNYTKELHIKHQNVDDGFIELENADHWTPWTYGVHNEVKKFLEKQGIIRKDYKKFDEQDTGGFPKKTTVPWMRRHLVPLIV